MKNLIYSIVSLIIGALITYFILTNDFGETKSLNPGAISLEEAYEHGMGHSDHLFQDFRKKTHGIMYKPALLSSYLDSINKFIGLNPLESDMPYYKWRIGIFYGKGLQRIPETDEETKNSRLMTMFMPVLINTEKHKILDVFEARYYYKKSDSTTKLPWDSKYTFYHIYKKYYLKYDSPKVGGKRATEPEDIVFNSGSMFP